MENSGDLVWVRLKGYPTWPAQITTPVTPEQKRELKNARTGSIFVIFFGSNDYAVVPSTSVYPFDCKSAPIYRKKSRSKLFLASVKEADAYLSSLEGTQLTTDHTLKRSKMGNVVSEATGSVTTTFRSTIKDDNPTTADTSLSEYEAKRQENIKRNEDLLKLLNLDQIKTNFGMQQVNKVPAQPRRHALRTQKTPKLPLRPRSRRLQGLNVDGTPNIHSDSVSNEHADSVMQIRRGTIHIIPDDASLQKEHEILDDSTVIAAEDMVSIAEDPETTRENQHMLDIMSAYGSQHLTVQPDNPSSLKNLRLRSHSTAKIVPGRIFSLTFLPTTDRLLILAGDKGGHLGVFEALPKDESDSCSTMFQPHTRPLSAIHINPLNMQEIYTSSYDGIVRCWRPDHAVFTEEAFFDDTFGTLIYSDIDFKRNCVFGCHDDGFLSISDMRTQPKKSSDIAYVNLHERKISHVHINPSNNNYIATSSNDRSLCIWDVRMLEKTKKTCKPVACATHSRSVSSRTILHNNQTGRWLTNFKAIWNPKCESYCCVGFMGRPRSIMFINVDSGKPIHVCRDEAFNSVTSVHAFHPLRNAVVGGNSSGRAFVWSD
eukprot:gene826-4106_t